MNDNPIKGIHVVSLNDKPYQLRFTWDGIIESNKLFPEGYNPLDPEQLGKMVAIALREHHPEMTEEVIRKLSPPIATMARAITTAMNYAFWGAAEPPKDLENPQ